MTMDLAKRKKNVANMLNSFMSYYAYHGLFFLVFSAQNYFFPSEDRYQFCFFILVIFYLQFVVGHVRQLNNESDMHRMGEWLRPRLRLKIGEHSLLALLMFLIPFYIQNKQGKPLAVIPGWILIALPTMSGLINLFMVKYEQTPCNATF